MTDSTHSYLAAVVEYDGTNYSGFQYQAHDPSIQATLEEALDRFCQRESRVVGSGRTDRGVHARGQVVAVRVDWKHDLVAFQRAWNIHLPGDIVVKGLCQAPSTFHPRFSAARRTYCYYVVNLWRAKQYKAILKLPLSDRYAFFEPKPLDLDAMNEAATYLIGEKDFATFGQATQGESTVRHLYEARWVAVQNHWLGSDAETMRHYVFTVSATGFLRQMVRNLVGALLEVGRGDWQTSKFAAALAAKNRSASAPPAPSHGLVLESVTYPDEFGISF